MSYKIILTTRYPAEDPEITTYLSGIKTREEARQGLLDCKEKCIYGWLASELSEDDWHVLTHDPEYKDIFNEAILDNFDYYFNGEDGTFVFKAWIEEEAELDEDLLDLAGVDKKELGLVEFFPSTSSYHRFKDQFYSRAEKNILDAKAFHFAFDSELLKLGFNLTDLFTADDSDALLKNKGTYGIIKKGLEDTERHIAVRALLRFWVLQFKDGAKLQSDIDKEKEEREKEEREKILAAAAEREKERAALKEKDLKRLNAIADSLKDTVSELEKLCLTYAQDQLDEKAIILNSKSAELDHISNRFDRVRISVLDNVKLDRAVLDYEPEIKGIKVTTDIFPNCYYYDDLSKGKVGIKLFVDVNFPSYYSRKERRKLHIIYYVKDDESVDLDECKKEFKDFIDEKINEVFKDLDSSLDSAIEFATNKLKYCTHARDLGKRAQALVDSGKDPEPSFFKTLTDIATEGRASAKAAMDSWSALSRPHHGDGSAELTYYSTLWKTADTLAYYLIDCNIDSPYGNYRITDNPKNLAEILNKALDKNDLESSITIVPSK